MSKKKRKKKEEKEEKKKKKHESVFSPCNELNREKGNSPNVPRPQPRFGQPLYESFKSHGITMKAKNQDLREQVLSPIHGFPTKKDFPRSLPCDWKAWASLAKPVFLRVVVVVQS